MTWTRHLEPLATVLAKRGARATLGGALVVLAAFVLADGSAWFAPLLVLGVVLLVAGILGPRVQGRLAVDFGPDGMNLSAQAHVAPSGRQAPARPALGTVDPAERVRRAALDGAIEGHGETIEFDAGELRAMLAEQEADRAGRFTPNGNGAQAPLST